MKSTCVALVIVAGAALAIPAAAQDSIGVVTAITGTATLSRGAQAAQPIRFRDRLQWRDVIETQKGASARALVLGKTSVTVRELSRVELREEALADGRRQTLDILAGKIRAVVERSLMDKGEQVEVRSPNAVAAVRGTDVVVEVIPPPARAQAFGMLAALEGGPLLAQGGPNVTTLVYTLSGVVDVTNGVTERIAAFQGARVQGSLPPQRFQFAQIDLPNIVRGLTVPPPPPTRTPPTSDATVARVERTALDQPLRGGAGTVGQPDVGRLTVPDKSVAPVAAGQPGGPGGGPTGAGAITPSVQPDTNIVRDINKQKGLNQIKNALEGNRDPLQQLDALEQIQGSDALKGKARDRIIQNPVTVQQIINVLTNASTQSASRLNATADVLQLLSPAAKNKVKAQVPVAHIDQIQDQALRDKIKGRLQ